MLPDEWDLRAMEESCNVMLHVKCYDNDFFLLLIHWQGYGNINVMLIYFMVKLLQLHCIGSIQGVMWLVIDVLVARLL